MSTSADIKKLEVMKLNALAIVDMCNEELKKLSRPPAKRSVKNTTKGVALAKAMNAKRYQTVLKKSA